jgi:hypothetical protein
LFVDVYLLPYTLTEVGSIGKIYRENSVLKKLGLVFEKTLHRVFKKALSVTEYRDIRLLLREKTEVLQ